MALQELKFSFKAKGELTTIPKEWAHIGVVGSGDLEILINRKELGGKTEFKVVTPVKGFDHIWEKVLKKFVEDMNIGNLTIEINDNNATPYIVSIRLKQALLEAKGGDGDE